MTDKTPAFPVFPETSVGHAAAHQGMTLRDYFAGQVLQALAMHEEYPPTRAAKSAYDYADSMMRARQE